MDIKTNIKNEAEMQIFFSKLLRKNIDPFELKEDYPFVVEWSFLRLIFNIRNFIEKESNEGLSIRESFVMDNTPKKEDDIDLNTLLPEGHPKFEPVYYILIYSFRECTCRTGRHGSRYTVSLKYNEESGWTIQT